jgi:histone deacetylase complex subunit SAP30
MKWASQDPAVLQSYRRAYRLDTPSTFHNPLSHVVLGHGIGRLSPTMARPKAQRRVHKDQLALAVRKNFNALGVSESDVIVDWLYKTKHQGTCPQPPCRRGSADAAADNEFRVRFAPQRR